MILFVLISIALMTLDQRDHLADPVRQVIQGISYPIHAAVDLPGKTADYLGDRVRTRRSLIDENEKLRAENLLLQSRVQRLDALERENISLRELLDSSYTIGQSVLIAELLRVDLDPYTHLIMINRGRDEGAFTGQPVLDAKGIMGQVDEAGPFSSVVRLITDPSHAIPVRVNRNGLRTVAFGTGDIHRLDINTLPVNADVRVGDLLVSSGLGGRFPQGYPVATVVSVDADPSRHFALIQAEPLAALDRSREVLLVKPQPQERVEDTAPDGGDGADPPQTATPSDS